MLPFCVRTVMKCKFSLFHCKFSDARGGEDWGDLRGVQSGKYGCLVLLKTWNLMDIKVDEQKSDRVGLSP